MKTFNEFIFECYYINLFSFLFEGKYSDEHAFRKVWNHFITHRKYGKEIRDLINSGKYDEARKAMEREIDAARGDKNHPLSFDKAKRGFEKGKDDNPDLSLSTYYDELKLAPDSVVAYTKGRRGKSAANRPTAYAKVEGGATPPTTRMWKDVVGKESDTSKRDISIADTRDRSYGQGISLKQGEGSQTLSAEPEEVRGLFQAAAKKYIQQLKRDGASKEEIERFERDVESNISKYIRAQGLKINPTENKEKSNKRLSIAQSAVDSLVKNYPGFDRLVDKEAASGEQKFGRKVSAQLDPESQEFKDALTALRVKTGKVNKSDLTGDEKKRVNKILSKYRTYNELSDLIKSSPSGEAREVVRGTYVDPKTGEVISRAKAEPVSQRGELDQPLAARSGKGRSTKRETGFIEFEKRRRGEEPERIPRSGALAGRVGPAEPDADKKSNQAKTQQGPITYKTFERRQRISQLQSSIEQKRQAQQAAELEQQSAAAQQALKDAEQEKADAQRDLETNSDGTKTYLQHRAQKRINNSNLNSRLTAADNAVQAANTTIADIQARASQAAEKPEPKPQAQQQTQPQRTEPVDTKPTTEPKPVETPKSQEPQQTPKPQEPQQTPKPQEPQETPNPQEPQETSVDKKERGRKKLEARMDASGQRLGLQ
jgi:hypothetical protein